MTSTNRSSLKISTRIRSPALAVTASSPLAVLTASMATSLIILTGGTFDFAKWPVIALLIFDGRGDVHPVTVLKAGPCVITQLKTLARDGYEAAQIGYVDFVKASKVNKAMTGHFAKSNVPPVKMIKEVALEVVKATEGEEAVAAKAGDRILVDIFNDE